MGGGESGVRGPPGVEPEVPGVPPPVTGKTQGAGTLLQVVRLLREGPAPCPHQQGLGRVSLDP